MARGVLRILDSIVTNFSFVLPLYFTACGESVFPVNFFIDGRKSDGQSDLEAAHCFFQYSRMLDGFYRSNGTKDIEGMDKVAAAHPVQPGGNVLLVVVNKGLYPNPTGILRTALNKNYDHFFQGLNGVVGAQLFPCGLG